MKAGPVRKTDISRLSLSAPNGNTEGANVQVGPHRRRGHSPKHGPRIAG